MTDKKISIAELRKMRAASTISNTQEKSEEKKEVTPEKKSVFVNRSEKKGLETMNPDIPKANNESNDIDLDKVSQALNIPKSEESLQKKSIPSYGTPYDQQDYNNNFKPNNNEILTNNENTSQEPSYGYANYTHQTNKKNTG